MGFIKNYSDLAINPKREVVLDLIEAGLYSIQPENNTSIDSQTALLAMSKKAKELGIKSYIYSDDFESDAELAGSALIKLTNPNSLLFALGKTVYKPSNPKGKGGRNQILVLGGLYEIDGNSVIASISSDGFDESVVAGAIGDLETLEKAKKLGLNPLEFLKNDDSFTFFKNVQDAIITGGLKTNISDLIIVYKQ